MNTKTMFHLMTRILLLLLLISCSTGEEVNASENGVCVSKGGRSQPYEFEGKLPESADLEFKDLNLCNVFHEKTCCSASRMLSASSSLEALDTYGEASKDCLYLFELLECSICHPDVGTQSGPLRICASFCDSVFEACSDAYFGTNNQVKERCLRAADDSEQEPCYGSKSILVTVVESLKRTARLQVLQYILEMHQNASLFVAAMSLFIMLFYQLGKMDVRR